MFPGFGIAWPSGCRLGERSQPLQSAARSSRAGIFRLEDDKIVEHWDVIQEVPEKSANNNGMF
jgi:predicted SnoaL-like aldol condensation-catalyzing enzyme